LKQRVLTGGLAAAVFLMLLYFGDFWFAGLILAMALLSFNEFIKMNHFKTISVSAILGFIGVFYFTFPWVQFKGSLLSFEASVWLLMLFFFAITVLSKNQITIMNISLLFIGVIYIGVGFHYMIMTRLMDHGLFWTLLVFACLWITDSAAYFTGWAIGKRLLWPSISPKKTVEGAVGGILFSMAAAILFSLYAPDLLPIQTAVWIGFLVAVIGQLGDFIQSAYKRVCGIKDTGAILPGHGGLLDRCDSWLIVFPFLHLLSILP
jgi:phosphatidate cytidylyltransferase